MAGLSDTIDSLGKSKEFHRPKSIDEALRVLNNAFTSGGEDLRELVADGVNRGREVAENVDRRVRDNPWPVIGGVAFGTLAVGFLLGRRRSSAASQSGT